MLIFDASLVLLLLLLLGVRPVCIWVHSDHYMLQCMEIISKCRKHVGYLPVCIVPELPLQQTSQDRCHKFTGRELERGADTGVLWEGKFATDLPSKPLRARTSQQEMPWGFFVLF